MEEIIDFVNTTGKNIGAVQNTKLAEYFEMSEGGIRKLKDKDKKKFESLYLGAFCKANNITKDELLEVIKNRKKV